ncbi:carbohydrate ABC transporter permease [Mesorhizobium koreense]|uniref:carbohydrate ABC transporter permease n=1 Tax=Mesorhizobium koreense TaxID=3074855 RepID=UPI00287BB782|nr:carbohydrate ABC transporter permease [Mesorhizobium sp. WR6]
MSASASSRHWRAPGGLALLAAALLAILTLFLLVYPAIYVLIGSFRPGGGLLSATGTFTFRNYVRIFQSGFGRFIFNSLAICVAATAASTILSIMAAYAFSRFDFRFKRALFTGILFGQVFPWIVLINPLFVAFATLHLINSYIGMILTYTAFTVPFSVYMLVGYLVTVPKSLDEAAIIDGASRWQVIWYIICPVMLPGFVATATYAFLLCWTEYLFALAFLTQTDLKTLPLGLYQFFGEDNVDWGAVMAASVVTTLPVFLLFLPIQGRISPGRIAGAVK